MKKFSLFLFASLFTLSSCSEDESSNSSSNSLTIDGQTFNINDAKATDNYHFYYDTHSEYSFALADGPITVIAEPDSFYGFETENASIAISLSMVSFGNTFGNGVYVFDEGLWSDPPASSFFDSLSINIDGNNDNDFNDMADKHFYATSGTITVSGSAPNYTLVFNVILNNGNTFQYTYNGGFDYVDNRND